jgi:PAS domain S-box-containing protein
LVNGGWMTKPKNANIAPRLMLGFFVQILIFLLFGVYALYDIHKVSDLSRNIYNHPLVVSNAALHANVSIAKMHRSMKDVVFFNSLSKIKKSIEAVNEEEKQVYRQLNIIKKDILGEEGKALERETRKLCDAWRPIRNEVIGLVQSDQRENAANITIGKGADHVSLLEANMLRLTQYARNKAFEFNRETESIQSKLGVTLIFFLVLGILTFLLVAFFSLKVTLSAEKELKEAEANLKNTFDLSPSIISKANINTGYFTQVSPVVTNILGFSVEEFTSRPLIEFVHPDDRQRTIDEISGQLQGNEVTYFENRYLCKDGSYKWISWQATPHDKKGIVTAVGSDITERKQAEEALKKAQSLLTETEKIGKVGGWEFNIDTEKVTWTEEVYNIHEIDPTDDLTVTKGVNFYTPDSKPIIERAVRRAINHGEPFDLELEIITAKGNIRTVHAIGKADPKHHRVHGFFQDITTRKMLQEESEKNKTILLEAEKLA